MEVNLMNATANIMHAAGLKRQTTALVLVLRRIAPLVSLVVLMHTKVLAFSPEYLVCGTSYHQILTIAAARECGFNPHAAEALSWHAEAIDLYLYNPFWLIDPYLFRFRVHFATKAELDKLHFDDLFSTAQVESNWYRLFAGTILGLLWAKERNDVAAAHHILGISLHAVQDFYSHSNWVDAPNRRYRTWFEVSPAERGHLNLWTGCYNHCGPTSIKPHGNILNPGIALDTRWMAAYAVRARGITDVTGDQLFNIALELARRASVQWLQLLERRMVLMGAGDFWNRVKSSASSTNERIRQFEDFNRMPYTFISAGAYPTPASRPVGDKEWFLRVRIKTGDRLWAGTDEDVVVQAGEREFLLDYAWINDFERGDDMAYVIGPFPTCPNRLTLKLRAVGSVAPDWYPEHIEVYAFSRVEWRIIKVLDRSIKRWMEPGDSIIFNLL